MTPHETSIYRQILSHLTYAEAEVFIEDQTQNAQKQHQCWAIWYEERDRKEKEPIEPFLLLRYSDKDGNMDAKFQLSSMLNTYTPDQVARIISATLPPEHVPAANSYLCELLRSRRELPPRNRPQANVASLEALKAQLSEIHQGR